MSSKVLSMRIPDNIWEDVDSSRTMLEKKNRIKPTRTAWVLEAINEKLDREKELNEE